MNPYLHPERRQAPVLQLTKTLRQQSNVWYTDATPFAQRPSCCAVDYNYPETIFTASTVPTPNIAAAEECAIALAIVRITASGTPGTIVPNSQDANRTISNGLGSPYTLQVIRTISDMHPLPQINLIWAPDMLGWMAMRRHTIGLVNARTRTQSIDPSLPTCTATRSSHTATLFTTTAKVFNNILTSPSSLPNNRLPHSDSYKRIRALTQNSSAAYTQRPIPTNVQDARLIKPHSHT
ncbi:hypothetical protein HPB48_026185 [Haemaphysalis longicornis]|uniref:Uncharacterized protein n=1 Tax=Haemaphysalis longicornis TaxID=44386 RepID=A0A9J6HBG3_HAELO|nr:hypothetical protein HPB48_026185 [Haemaphysalis longicornis]